MSSAPEVLRLTAFPDAPEGGNPAGVVLDARGLDDASMLSVAAQVGYSETAFVVAGSSPGSYDVRYFSPRAEVPFCGHATIAAAVALAERDGPGRLELMTRVGSVPVQTRHEAGATWATLTSVPTRTRPATSEEVADLLAALRWDAADLDPALPAHVAFAGNEHPVLAVRERSRLAELDYDYAALEAVMARRGWTTTVLLVWARSATEFHVRNPFPPGGVVEDPATGAAAAAFGGYLRSLGLAPVPSRLTLLQGADMGRPCRLLVDLVEGEAGVSVTGTARAV